MSTSTRRTTAPPSPADRPRRARVPRGRVLAGTIGFLALVAALTALALALLRDDRAGREGGVGSERTVDHTEAYLGETARAVGGVDGAASLAATRLESAVPLGERS